MRTRMMLLLPLAALLACGGSDATGTNNNNNNGGNTNPGGGGNPTATTAVTMSGNTFSPSDIKVSPGATVTWTNNDGYAHNVTFSSSSVTGSGDFSTGSKALVMPSTAGTYAYHCTRHSGMTGSVVVQ